MGAFMADYRREDSQGNGEILMEKDGMDSWERPISANEGARSAFILGILSIVFSVICQVVGLILGIIGLSKAKRSDRTDKEGEAAWVLSVIGIVLNAVILALVFAFIVGILIFMGAVGAWMYW